MLKDAYKYFVVAILGIAFLGYSFYLYAAIPMQRTFLSAEADKGKFIWQKLNCTACHQVYGLGGFLGPDLTNEYSLRGPDFIKAFLKTGTNTMPVFPLSDEEISSVIAYLQHIDRTGISDPRSFKINADGTIRQ